jgi:hypothetical protein
VPGRRLNRPGKGGGRRPSLTSREGRSQDRLGGVSSQGSQSGRRPVMRSRMRRRLIRWGFISIAATVAVLVIASFGLSSFGSYINPRGTGATGYQEGVGIPQTLMPTSFHRTGQTINYLPGLLATTVAQEVGSGSTVLTIALASGLSVGDSLVVGEGELRESVKISSIDGNQLSLSTALVHDHVPDAPIVRLSVFKLPPTSGNHWASASAPTMCGFYEDGVRDEVAIHNLEHGNVVISYNFTDPSDVAKIKEIHDGFAASDQWLVTRFYDNIPVGDIAMTAWGVLDQFTGIQENRINAFFKAYKGNRFSEEGRMIGRGAPCNTTIRHQG